MAATSPQEGQDAATYPQPQHETSADYPPPQGGAASPTITTDAERELDGLRAKVFPAAVSHLVLGLVGLPFCWVGYGFVVVLCILLITLGAVGVCHLSSMAQLRFSTCCCFPLNTVRQLHTWYVVSCIFATLATVTCLIQVIVNDSQTVRIFAAIAIVLSLLSLGALIYGARAMALLRDRCQLDEQMLAGPFAGHVTAVQGQQVNPNAMVAPAPAPYYPQHYAVYAVPQHQQYHQQPHPYYQHQQHQQHQQHHHAPTAYPPPPPQQPQGYYGGSGVYQAQHVQGTPVMASSPAQPQTPSAAPSGSSPTTTTTAHGTPATTTTKATR
mmetsp:Transcript_25807/g.79624  ORF Transcript_25807/g.79624 Transcript_25807/m.79624 type:complete len:326 (-) Transcript_25807:334-1311(-)